MTTGRRRSLCPIVSDRPRGLGQPSGRTSSQPRDLLHIHGESSDPLRPIIQNHSLPDGNKRNCGHVQGRGSSNATSSGSSLGVADTPDAVADVLVALTTHSLSEREFVRWVADPLRPGN